MKRLLYALLILGIVAAIVIAGYLLRFKGGDTGENGGINNPPDSGTSGDFPGGGNPPPPPQGGQGTQPPKTTPQPVLLAEQKFGLVAQNSVMDYVVDSAQNIVIMQPDGRIVKINDKGQETILSETPIADLFGASFSYDGSKILVLFGNRISPQQSVFDVASKTWRPLDPTILEPSWSPHTKEIVYVAARGTKTTLETLDLGNAKAKPRELFSLRAFDLVPRWIAPNQILLAEKSSAATQSSLWTYDIKNKTFSPLLVDQRGLETAWNSSGTRGLAFNAALRSGGELKLVDKTGASLRQITLSTLPSKCLFVNETKTPSQNTTSTQSVTSTVKKPPVAIKIEVLYCAIPQDRQYFLSSTLPDDYLKNALFTADDFYGVNLTDGTTSLLFGGTGQSLDASKLKIFGSRLYFVNRLDQKLYAILRDIF